MISEIFKFHNLEKISPQRRASIYASLKRLFFSFFSQRSISQEYDSIWLNKNIQNFKKTTSMKRSIFYKGDFYNAPLWFLNAFYINFIEREIALKSPNLVYELGSGNGLNIFALAAKFPNIKFIGFELTNEGVAQSNIIKKDPFKFLDAYNFIYSTSLTQVNFDFKNVYFYQKDVSEHNTFQRADFLYTILALEQMNSVFDEVVNGLSTYVKGDIVLIEPFLDFNRNINEYLFLKSKGYLYQGSKKLRNLCNNDMKKIIELPSKQKFNVGALKFSI